MTKKQEKESGSTLARAQDASAEAVERPGPGDEPLLADIRSLIEAARQHTARVVTRRWCSPTGASASGSSVRCWGRNARNMESRWSRDSLFDYAPNTARASRVRTCSACYGLHDISRPRHCLDAVETIGMVTLRGAAGPRRPAPSRVLHADVPHRALECAHAAEQDPGHALRTHRDLAEAGGARGARAGGAPRAGSHESGPASFAIRTCSTFSV
jgi:hypothetical protein